MGIGALIAIAVVAGATTSIISAARSGGGGGGPGAITPLPQTPSIDDASEKAERVARQRRARATKSVFTSPLGIDDQANVVRKTLTGQ